MKVLVILRLCFWCLDFEKIQISDKNHDFSCLMSKRTLKVTQNCGILLNRQKLEGCKSTKNNLALPIVISSTSKDIRLRIKPSSPVTANKHVDYVN